MTTSTPSVGLSDLLLAYGLNTASYIAALLLVMVTLLVSSGRGLHSSANLSQAAASPQLRLLVLVSLVSLSGLPPLFGFFAKFFLIVLLAAKGAWPLLLAFGALNLFALYFYFQQVRYLTLGGQRREFRVILNRAVTHPGVASLQTSAFLFLLFGGALSEGLSLILSITLA
jgi:NADH:ubiquinone oxidoreductase subunit 2 (subunit N)